MRIGKVRTDDGRRCLFAASIDGARVGVLVARRAPSIPDHPEAVSNAVGAPPLPGQLPLLDIQNATPRRLLFGPVTDDTRVYVRCIAASDADGEEAVPIFLLSGRDSAQPVVDAAAFGLDAADVTALQRARGCSVGTTNPRGSQPGAVLQWRRDARPPKAAAPAPRRRRRRPLTAACRR